ncbi:MAG: hypothetical protein IJK23_11080 [Clostridia bacterium]|nr:hypothetical protein [Clostridia bacterium]
MNDTYRITLHSPLGIRYGVLTIRDAGEDARLVFSLFGIQSELAAEKRGDAVEFGGDLRFITGTRPCAGEFTVSGEEIKGRLCLRGVSIPLLGSLDKTPEEAKI